MSSETPEPITVVVTCHTAGCGNGDHAITVTTFAGAGFTCGVCGETITDVVEGGDTG